MSVSTPRRVARAVLADVRSRDAWGGALLRAAIEAAGLDMRDTAFVTRLVYGTLAAEGTLDEALDRHLARPRRVHPLVRDIMRMAAYELLFARTPAHAVVHDAVSAVRGAHPSSAGMANAVLRRVAEEAESFPWGDPATDRDALARASAHPRWLVDRFFDDLGPARAREALDAASEPAPVYVAHNPFLDTYEDAIERFGSLGVEVEETGPPGCLRVNPPGPALRSDVVARGSFIVSDAASQTVAMLAAPPPGGTAVDVAAGRGTKTVLMQAAAARAGGAGRITASDLHAFKVEILRERLTSLGVPNVDCIVVDATTDTSIAILGGEGSADRVLVDAPCSNLGTLRRHPEKRWRLNPEEIDSLAALGERMLHVASRLVRGGGFVVYSTCTVTRRENADVVEAFLASEMGRGFSTAPVHGCVPEGWQQWVTSEGWLQTHPTRGGPDGHFAAVLLRSDTL